MKSMIEQEDALTDLFLGADADDVWEYATDDETDWY
jgi:hypothetical protein